MVSIKHGDLSKQKWGYKGLFVWVSNQQHMVKGGKAIFPIPI
jgi:hypothetical protein